MATSFVSVPDGGAPGGVKRVAYTREGYTGAGAARLTFVCVPGLGDTLAEYRRLSPLLRQHGDVVTTDLRGLGGSDVGFASYLPDDTGRDVEALLEALGASRVVLVGCSMAGAAVVWAATGPQRARVAGVVFINPFAWDHPMPFCMGPLLWTLMNRWTGPGLWASYYRGLYPKKAAEGGGSVVPDLDAYVAALRAHLGSHPGRVQAVAAQMFGSKGACEERLPGLAASGLPALALYGGRDPDFASPLEEGRELVARLSHGRPPAAPAPVLAVIEGCGHYPHVEAPEEVAAHVAAFVAAL